MENKELIEKAKNAMLHAYTPYSGFRVGAALLTDTGEVFRGCNIENASYGATICAERTAIVKAVSEGFRNFTKIAIVSSGELSTFPCGICRQVITEFMPDGIVVVEDKEKGIQEFLVSALLPEAFTL